jgi:hypothetical protein
MAVESRGKRPSRGTGVLLPVCVVCEQTPAKGIAGGMVVSGQFLCDKCEQEIVKTQVGDSRYGLIKEKIKKLWGSLGRRSG